MVNRHRGEIAGEFNGKSYTLCLTLGALAELESVFGVGDLVDLAKKFETGRMSARDILRIIGCGLRGGGNAISDEELATFTVAEGLNGYVRIAADLLAATFADTAVIGKQPDFPSPPQGT